MNIAELRLAVTKRAKSSGRLGALVAGATLKALPHAKGDLDVSLWGRKLKMPASHHLPFIVRSNPLWSMSLVHCAAALGDSHLSILDIGANIGDSPNLLESFLPGRCSFICVEPNTEWLPYLKANTAGLPVNIIHSFIGEGQSLVLKETAPGSAVSEVADSGERSVSLDEICNGRQLDLIKIDTDGFDFPILRSGKHTLSSRTPPLFFEWDPNLWRQQGEKPEAVFDWLTSCGYHDFCFFGDSGLFYCRTMSSQPETIRSLVAAADARRGIDALHWDVFAAPSDICDRAIQISVAESQKVSSDVQPWNRLQPVYWQ